MSERSVVEKLHLKPGQRLFLASPPAGFKASLRGLAPTDLAEEVGPAAVVLAFIEDRADLERSVPPLVGSMDPGAALWIAYPKASSGAATDLNRDKIWEWARAHGLDAVANFSMDGTWSALRLKVR